MAGLVAAPPPRYFTLAARARAAGGGGPIRFRSGKGYYVAPQFVAAPKPAPTAPPPLYTPMSADEMKRQAGVIASGIIDPQQAAIDRQIALTQRDEKGQGQAYAGVIDAVNRLTAGIPGSIQGAYQEAGNDVSGYAGALTGQAGDAARAQAAEVASRLAALGAPGTVAANTAGLDTANYLGGALPASNLAAEAANRLAEAQGLRAAGDTSLGQQALQALQATGQEVNDLRSKGLDLELTRPAEIAKAINDLRSQDAAGADLAIKQANLGVQQKAADAQIQSIDRAWYQAMNQEAYNRTNATGNLWVVQGNRLVDTGKPAPGSAAGRALSTAAARAADRVAATKRTRIQQTGATTRAKITANEAATRAEETNRHNMAMEGIANSRIGISQTQAETAANRERRMARSAGKGGFSSSQIAKWGDTVGKLAYSAFHGVPNPNYNASAPTDPKDPNYDPKAVARYVNPPVEPGEFLRAMLARHIPYSIAYDAIRRYASAPNSWWSDALSWQAHWPPPGVRLPKPGP